MTFCESVRGIAHGFWRDAKINRPEAGSTIWQSASAVIGGTGLWPASGLLRRAERLAKTVNCMIAAGSLRFRRASRVNVGNQVRQRLRIETVLKAVGHERAARAAEFL